MTTYDRTKAVQIIRAGGLSSASALFAAAATTTLPLPGACALVAKESGGRNVYGHDKGGALSGYPGTVDASNFDVFWWLVNTKGQASNGVGPCQLTYPGFFTDMLAKGLKPWDPADNMGYGFTLLLGYVDTARTANDPHIWVTAGTRYNGARAYGVDLAAKVHDWTGLLAPAAL